jgi:hypothetical protein
MAIKRPDIYEHNNPLNSIVDSDFVRGGTRTAVNNLNELYQIGSGINDKLDQLKAYATRVYVSGENKFYLLTNLANRTNVSGWTPESYITTGDTGIFYPRSNPSGFITGVDTSSLYPRSNPSGFITGVNLSGYVTTGYLNQVSGNLQSQIDTLSVNSIAYAIALG